MTQSPSSRDQIDEYPCWNVGETYHKIRDCPQEDLSASTDGSDRIAVCVILHRAISEKSQLVAELEAYRVTE